jgi:hypothetical protein
MADRLDRRRIMIACDLLGAVTYAGMAVTSAPLPLITLGSLAALLHSPFDIACAVALALSLRWTPWRPAEAGPVPHTTGP